MKEKPHLIFIELHLVVMFSMSFISVLMYLSQLGWLSGKDHCGHAM